VKEHPAERHQEAKKLLGDALRAHPAYKKLVAEGKPLWLPYMTHDVVGLDYGEGKAQIRFRCEDPTWHSIRNQFEARRLADFLVFQLREKLREAKREARKAPKTRSD
jgi:hypothetical protein